MVCLRKFGATLCVAPFFFVSGLPVPAISGPVQADDSDQALFILGGRFVTGDMLSSFNPVAANYEDNYLIGLGYQHFFSESAEGWRIGGEAGVAGRFASNARSVEIWGGMVTRYDGWQLGDLRLSPSVSLGLSAVSSTQETERIREQNEGGSAALLAYLSPEVSVSHADHPNIEVFTRAHHRSGAWGAIGNMAGSANAVTAGLRFKF